MVFLISWLWEYDEVQRTEQFIHHHLTETTSLAPEAEACILKSSTRETHNTTSEIKMPSSSTHIIQYCENHEVSCMKVSARKHYNCLLPYQRHLVNIDVIPDLIHNLGVFSFETVG